MAHPQRSKREREMRRVRHPKSPRPKPSKKDHRATERINDLIERTGEERGDAASNRVDRLIADAWSRNGVVARSWHVPRWSHWDRMGCDRFDEFADLPGIVFPLQIKSSWNAANAFRERHPDIPVVVANPAQHEEVLLHRLERDYRQRCLAPEANDGIRRFRAPLPRAETQQTIRNLLPRLMKEKDVVFGVSKNTGGIQRVFADGSTMRVLPTELPILGELAIMVCPASGKKIAPDSWEIAIAEDAKITEVAAELTKHLRRIRRRLNTRGARS